MLKVKCLGCDKVYVETKTYILPMCEFCGDKYKAFGSEWYSKQCEHCYDDDLNNKEVKQIREYLLEK